MGCGVGHWGQLLAPLFSENARVTGVDREKEWIGKAAERAEAMGLASRYHYQKGDATALPFADNTFDLVTCQTVLIHLKEPKMGLREMLRVLKPQGLLLLAEPNNFSNRAIGSSLTEQLSIDAVMDRLRFGLLIERGKQALGLGFNSVGDLIPGYVAQLGGENIRVYLSDKAVPFFPPYSSKEQRINIEQIRDWAKRKFIGWDRDEVLSYFIAGGGQKKEFDRYYDQMLKDGEEAIQAMDKGTYHTGGGALTYLIAAQKPKG